MGGGGEAEGGGHVVPRGVYGIEGCKSLSSISLRCNDIRTIEWCNLPALSHLELDCPSLVSHIIPVMMIPHSEGKLSALGPEPSPRSSCPVLDPDLTLLITTADLLVPERV